MILLSSAAPHRIHQIRAGLRSCRTLWIGCLLCGAVSVSSTVQANDSSDDIVPILRDSCFHCHGQSSEAEGGVDLASAFHATPATNLDLLEQVIRVLEDQSMPPESEAPLDQGDRDQLIRALKQEFEAALVASSERPKTPLRRMNRFQYSNAVQDLLQLNVDVFALPERMCRSYGYFDPGSGHMPEQLKAGSRPLGKSQLISKRLAGVAPFPQDLRAEHGFDNQADHLTLSPVLMKSFMKLARAIVDSPDFSAKTCGSWESLMEPPPDQSDWRAQIDSRLASFLQRAFRRPVPVDVRQRYSDHVLAAIEDGTSFTDAMKSAVSAALASPRFLYLYDLGPQPNDARDDFDLATRLSLFLWGSLPDDELLAVAASGRLSDLDVLNHQLDRMLNDVRMKRFCDSFPSQWLQLERIISSVPDPEMHPEFYFTKYRVSMHMMLEPLLLFETLLIENRSVMELISSDFSYRSDLLQSWYRTGKRGKKAIPVAIPFKRVTLQDEREGGVITTAAIMTMTSNATRTQPITRGAWIASVIFNDPPQPPPADVPALNEDPDGDLAHLTLRERLEAHRQRADCAGCHAKIDPLGFALENYGPTGLWRTEYRNGRAIDASGVLFRKHQFDDIVQFKAAILSEQRRFVRGFAGHLLSFALCRPLAAVDSRSLDAIVRSSESDSYAMRTLIKQVALSDAFRQPTLISSGE